MENTLPIVTKAKADEIRDKVFDLIREAYMDSQESSNLCFTVYIHNDTLEPYVFHDINESTEPVSAWDGNDTFLARFYANGLDTSVFANNDNEEALKWVEERFTSEQRELYDKKISEIMESDSFVEVYEKIEIIENTPELESALDECNHDYWNGECDDYIGNLSYEGNIDETLSALYVINPLENQKLTFSLVTLDDSWEFFCSDYVDKHNVEDTDGFAEYTENYNGKVKANINYCVIGESDTETESPTSEQLEFICDHWNELSDKAEILENDTFYVEVENEETEDEECDLEP